MTIIKLHQMLGLADAPANGFAWHDRILEGLPGRSMRTLGSSLGMTRRELLELAMPDELFHHRMTLSAETSNFMYRVALALRQVMPSLQNDMKRSAQWLRKPNVDLKGRIPLELLQTHTGSEFVFTAIARMKPELAGFSGYAKSETVDEAPEQEEEVAELQ
jgi:putative toxin-antitoxin system antitoxin component (TIGR02293 family)